MACILPVGTGRASCPVFFLVLVSSGRADGATPGFFWGGVAPVREADSPKVFLNKRKM